MTDKSLKVVVLPVTDYPIEEEFDVSVEYEWIKKAIGGGWLEALRPHPNVTLWFDEEGKLKGLPPNPTATWLWWFLEPEARGRDVLCGTVVATGGPDAEGDSTSLPDAMIDLMVNVVGPAIESRRHRLT